MDFGSHTDAVVAVAVALVNTVTPGQRRGRNYSPPSGQPLSEALGDALRHGRQSVVDPRGRTVDALVRLAFEVRPIFGDVAAGRIDQAVTTANDLLGRYRPVPYLDRHDGEPWHLHFHGPPGPDPSEWGGGIAVGLATVLGSEYADRLGVCRAPACDRVFVDISRNGTRTFCSTACQNRVKAASHRARLAAGEQE